ncbi:hypothetical protein BT69DRAFT_1029216 [Atractiella rhizophila]|nr:hypothetical protein BT69DRAFT_1029216 [Atractiella rhizophila]
MLETFQQRRKQTAKRESALVLPSKLWLRKAGRSSFGSVKEFGGYLAGNKDMEDRGRVQKEAGRAEYHNPNEIVPSGAETKEMGYTAVDKAEELKDDARQKAGGAIDSVKDALGGGERQV